VRFISRFIGGFIGDSAFFSFSRFIGDSAFFPGD
jgi:hypothetical protein